MNLSDKTIRALLFSGKMHFLPPLDKDQIQCGSIDLRLGNDFKIMTPGDAIDTRKRLPDDLYITRHAPDDEAFTLPPGGTALATTKDYMVLPDDIGGTVHGRSSIGRLFVFAENAGWVDPGFEGEITLELFNASPRAMMLYPGMRIAQIVLEHMDDVPDSPYRGKYQGQMGATVSRVYLDGGE